VRTWRTRVRSGIVSDVVDASVFVSAALAFSALVDQLPADGWDRPGLGSWDVRALTGHGSRSLITVSTYIRRPADVEALASPEEYYAMVASVSAADAAAVEQRGRDAGEALGNDPGATVRRLAQAAIDDVGREDDPLIETIGGGMRLSAYLPTRTFELVVHGLDLAGATGSSFTAPDAALAEAVELAARIAVTRGWGVEVLLALTGRGDLPAGFSVV
jgi:uncharacterized protein (TIGR03083 family)